MWQCLLIEDDQDNARYLSNGLTELGHMVTVSPDGVSGLENAMKDKWDIIILDRILPNHVDGLSILSTLRALNKKTPVLVLSALSAVDDRVDGLRAGGDDYLVKPFSFSELVARLDALIRRTRPELETKELRIADLVVNVATQKVQRAGTPISLQPQEFRLLVYLMLNPHRIITRTMLLETIWGYSFDPQSNVIDVQVSRLRRKIDGGSAVPLIHTIRGTGYILSDTHGPGQAGSCNP
ncbi:response regulator transcription factor [Achromobacter sp. GG226]|uniref:response regulator transcription factor n=1 Tax=Verticiella alkaliphila TaxID=2779529 RepID=UPI001C0C1A30|nr:response regulator transcription factor [Verticiella sp. GG226]MBU4611752.1 response regulator transcription factor [Verticiella sp. GG226]